MNQIAVDPNCLHLISKELAWHYQILPFAKTAQLMSLYCSDDIDVCEVESELEVVLGYQINLNPIPKKEIERLLGTHYIIDRSAMAKEMPRLTETKNFLGDMISEARNLKSSDIHIETYEHFCRVRIRIDGVMVERYRLNRDDYPSMINKVKIMSNLDIAEKRLPQDGRINFKSADTAFDIRVSILPTLYGEKIVLRLLNNSSVNIELTGLGFSESDFYYYMQGIRRPQGIVLISGPTGSGKTTTLYATLKELNKESRNILTIEDPIEYTVEGVNQVQLKENIGMGFPEALRTFLRQDPDVIMVGEIRDVETANMAIRAALTGHLVLSTIHTNSAWGTVSRLSDMGVPPFLLAGTLNTSVAQRLIRLLCPECKTEQKMDLSLYPKGFQPFSTVKRHFIASGCPSCHFTGYRGRKAVYEVIPIDEELSIEIKKGNLGVGNLLKKRNICTLAENAFSLFSEGKTAIDEIYPLLLNY